MEVKVSVIIPVYNAEKYIQECIQSLLNQTIKECEFIFIDDGSTDKSREMIEYYQKKDKRIIFVSQKNQGVSVARNQGLKLARGKYIGFVDADDYIKEDMYMMLYETAILGDKDVVICNFESESDGRIILSTFPFTQDNELNKEFIEKELIPYFIKTDHLNSVVNKIYKNQIIREKKLCFPKGVALGEDGLFNIHFFSHAERAMSINYVGYHYREVDGSATRNIVKTDYFSRAIEVYHQEYPVRILEKIPLDKLLEYKSMKLVNSVISYIHLYSNPESGLHFSDRYKYTRKMIESREVSDALRNLLQANYEIEGRYEKYIIEMMKRRSVLGLLFATAYSRFRNKK